MLDPTEVLNSVVGGLLLTLILAIFGLPQQAWKKLSAFQSRSRVKRKMASGLYDDDTLESALRYYVRPKYASVDPAEYQEPAESLLDARADLFNAMDKFLAKPSPDMKYFFILGDSGMGKTSFLLNYFSHNYKVLRLRKRNIQLVSLSQGNPEGLIDAIAPSDRKEMDLFLDAFDEDPSAVGRIEERLKELLRHADGYRTVTVSCRTQFFLSDECIPVNTGIAKAGVVPLGVSKHYRFIKVYIAPFDNPQVRQYLRYRYPGMLRAAQRRSAMQIVEQVPSLSVRPMLLAHMPEILASKVKVSSAIDVYDEMVRAWAERESPWIAPHELLRLSKFLALDFYRNREERGGEYASPVYIHRVARALAVNAIEEHITSRSLLNRTSAGQFKFAHRSIMEYFLALSVLEGGAGLGLALTDQTAKFIAQRLRCMSAEVGTFFTSCSIDVEVVAPDRKLGYATNFCLLRQIDASVDSASLLGCKAGFEGGGKAILKSVLAQFARANDVTTRTPMSHVRIRVPRSLSEQREYRQAYVAVWFSAICVLAPVELHANDLRLAMRDDPISTNEYTIVGSPSGVGRGLEGFKWHIEARNGLVEAQRSRAGDLSALDANHAVSFEYDRTANHLLIRMIEGYVDDAHPLGQFGVLDTLPSLTIGSDFTVLGPVNLGLSARRHDRL